MKKIQTVSFIIFAVACAIAPSIVSAATTPVGFSMLATEDAARTLHNEPLFQTITVVMNWLLGLIGVLGVIAFVISGIMYLTSAGDEGQAEKAKSVMTFAIIGLVVALVGLIIVNAVAGLTDAGGVLTY